MFLWHSCAHGVTQSLNADSLYFHERIEAFDVIEKLKDLKSK